MKLELKGVFTEASPPREADPPAWGDDIVTTGDAWGYIADRGTIVNNPDGSHTLTVQIYSLGANYGIKDVGLIISDAVKRERQTDSKI